MHRVVLDTSVLVSGTLFAGSPGRVLELARDGSIRGVTSLFILREYQEVLTRPKLGVAPETAERLAIEIADFTEVVAVEAAAKRHCKDAGDDAVVETALQAGATLIVTGDKTLLAARVAGIGIVSPAELLGMVGDAADR